MAGLVDAQAHRDRGVVGERALARPMQVFAPFDGAMQLAADVNVVVEIAQAGAADPAMRVITTRAELVCGAHSDRFELVMQAVLPRKEAWETWFVVARHSVVVARD